MLIAISPLASFSFDFSFDAFYRFSPYELVFMVVNLTITAANKIILYIFIVNCKSFLIFVHLLLVYRKCASTNCAYFVGGHKIN